MEAALHPWPALGALLMRDGLVTREQLEAVLVEQRDSAHQRISGKRLGEALVEQGVVDQAQVAQLVAEQYTLPFLELTQSEVGVRAAVLVPEELARRVVALPISELPDGSLLVAVADPPLALFSDELHTALGVPLRFAVATPDAVDAAITFAFERARQLAPTDTPESQPTNSASALPSEVDAADDGDDDATFEGEPAAGLTRPWPALGALLIRDGVVTEAELDAALAQQRVSGSRRLGEILVQRGSVTANDVARLVAEQYELPFVDLVATEVEIEVASRLPEELARRRSAVPVHARDGEILVALADPTTVLDAHELRSAFDVPVRFVAASPEAVRAALDLVHVHDADEVAFGEPPPSEVDDPDAVATLDDDVQATVVALSVEPRPESEPTTDDATPSAEHAEPTTASPEADADAEADDDLTHLLEDAIALGASHVHFAPRHDEVVVRARVAGVLRELDRLSGDDGARAMVRLKDLVGLDETERRTPCESHIAVTFGDDTLDLRLAVVPTRKGEKLTLTVSDSRSRTLGLSELGLEPTAEATLRAALHEPSGAVVVCGPAGSGRTTTLYAALRELDVAERSIATVEHPIEQELEGADQIEAAPNVGLTIARGLRAALRSDVDVLAVGELDDDETARLLMRAASGHLVLTTLDNLGSASAVRRLAHMSGVGGAALTCVVSQRLVRMICTDCRETYYPEADELAQLGRAEDEAGRRLLGRGRGCTACGDTGFRGRLGLFEVLPVTEEIRSLLDADASRDELHQAAVRQGMRTLTDEGVRLCLEGVTTAAEVRRVLGARTS
jgi:type IV pilus assembly protein PilB